MAPYWEYLRWAAYVATAVSVWRILPLALVRLVAAFTRNEKRHRQCMEVLRLSRRDAAHIPSYLSESPPSKKKPMRAVPTPKT